MKTQISRSAALLLLAVMGLTSCSVEYRERHKRRVPPPRMHETIIIKS